MMKKISLLFVILACIVQFANAQRGSKSKAWLEIGLKGGGGISVISNKNIWDDKKTVALTLSPCFSYGGKLAINFNESHQLAFEGMAGMRSQQYEFLLDKVKYNKTLKYNVTDLGMLYRYNSSNGGYVELGGQYSMLVKATETNDNGSVDITNYLTNYTSGVLGFGGNLVQAGMLTWTLGVRFTYSFTDLISAEGGANESFSYPLNDAIVRKEYDSYKLTKPVTAQLITELNFDIGYLAKSNCKRGRVSFMSF